MMNLIPLRSRAVRTAGLIILIVALVLLLVDIPTAIEAARNSDWSEWAIGALFLLIAYALLPLRTSFLTGRETSYKQAMYADASGFMFSILMQLPNAPFRAFALNRSAEVDGARATSALTLEIMTGWLVRGVIFAMAVALLATDARDAERPLLNTLIVGVVLLGLLLILARNSQRVEPALQRGLVYLPRINEQRAATIAAKAGDSLHQMASLRRFGITLLLTLLVWMASFVFYFFSFESMNVEAGRPHLLIALAALVVAPPSSPMMIGVFHGAVIAILGTLKLLEPDDATGYALLLHFMQIVIVVTAGFFSLRKMNLDFREMVRDVRERGDARSQNEPEEKAA
jgi:uncharacterized membrane protein YbhN (UPF0104 family)